MFLPVSRHLILSSRKFFKFERLRPRQKQDGELVAALREAVFSGGAQGLVVAVWEEVWLAEAALFVGESCGS